MGLSDMLTRDVEILHPAVITNRAGNEVYDYDNLLHVTTAKGWIQQRSSDEVTEPGRAAYGQRGVAFFHVGTPVMAHDVLRDMETGVMWQVDGSPRTKQRPFGDHHLSVDVRWMKG